MVRLTFGSPRLRCIDSNFTFDRTRLFVVLSVLLLAFATTACSSGPTAHKTNGNGILGRGGADPFWEQIANKAQNGGAESAIEWARAFESGGVNAGLASRYSGLCLEFAANAYGASYSTPYATAWDLARASKLNGPDAPTSAPRGALMFFDLSSQGIPEGHVGISLGGGAMISALEHSPNVQVTPSIDGSQSKYWKSAYRGWAWPPANWGPLAKQAAGTATTNQDGGMVSTPTVQIDQDVQPFSPLLYEIFLNSFPPNTDIPVSCFDSSRPAGFATFTMRTDESGSAINGDRCTIPGKQDDHWVIANGIQSNHFIDTGGADVNEWETAGGTAHTWTDYIHAGGIQGPSVNRYQTILVSCRIRGFVVADGNPWWYLIESESGPAGQQVYVSADAFYNNGAVAGSLKGTPWVDPKIPICDQSQGSPQPTATPDPRPVATSTPRPAATSTPRPAATSTPSPTPLPPPTRYYETTGGVTHTWSNYMNAGGTQGQSIPAYTTVQIACKLTGFKVADGNLWWYRIAQSPWSGQYYASADAFYNNGQTSGSLLGTPWVDPSVPNC